MIRLLGGAWTVFNLHLPVYRYSFVHLMLGVRAMSPKEQHDTSRLLARFANGDTKAEEELYPIVQSELRRRAHALMRVQGSGHTLQTTALVHEAWMRLVQTEQVDARTRATFHALAARAMRSVLVDYARARQADKRGNGLEPVELKEVGGGGERDAASLLDLHEALQGLQHLDDQLHRISELRLFAGLEHAEIAEALGISSRTSERAWRSARAWLRRKLEKGT